jgi:hypothetical protein
MSYFDSPIIDPSSRNSERSERRVRDFLNQDAGFILRPEVPDKGCDFDAELILDQRKASSWKFAIQLKSIEQLQLVHEGKYISFSFETSRLGYLMRRIPAMGIVILYSVEEHKCFYEYVDVIYTRLMEERESDEWKNNDKVSIHIPYINGLSLETTGKIHSTFTHRFQQAVNMQNAFGHKYDLPLVDIGSDFKYDFHNPRHIIQFLHKYGLLLINNSDFPIIYEMITQITNQEIYRSKDLLIIAAVAYAEIGLHVDSELYCKKLAKFSMQNAEKHMVLFVEFKNRLALGNMTGEQFLNELAQLSTEVDEEQNKINIEINTIRYRLANLKAFEKIPADLLPSIEKLFVDINKLQTTFRIKALFTLWNLDNLSFLAGTISSAAIGEMRMRVSLGDAIPVVERAKAAMDIIRLENIFNNSLQEINRKAVEDDDKLLVAHSFSGDVRHFINHQINYYSFAVPVLVQEDFEKRIERKITYAARAFAIFKDLGIYNEAYDNVCNALEIIEMAEGGYGLKSPVSKTELYSIKQQLEAQLDIAPRQIVFLALIEKRKTEKATTVEKELSIFKGLNDEQIESMARTTLVSFHLPEERLVNIINEMKAFRLFYQRCNNKEIIVLQFRSPYDQQEPYKEPVLFVLSSLRTGVQTNPSADMDALLRSWRY